MSLSAEGMVVHTLRKPTATGRTELEMTPVQFIHRLASLTPPPWFNAIRFHGVFASASRHRTAVAQRVAAEQDPHDDPLACLPLRRQQATNPTLDLESPLERFESAP